MVDTIEPDTFDTLINEDVYNKNMDVVGPVYWAALHTFSLSYPVYPDDMDKQRATDYLINTFEHLPCLECAIHASEFSENVRPVDLESRAGLVWWLFDLHNDVNKRNSKPIFSRQDFINKFMDPKLSSVPDLKADSTTQNELSLLEDNNYDNGFIWKFAATIISLTIISLIVMRLVTKGKKLKLDNTNHNNLATNTLHTNTKNENTTINDTSIKTRSRKKKHSNSYLY